MAVFPFTVRATDSEGSYSDRQFNITVRNSRVERYMVIDVNNAYTSPDGQIWTQRNGAGGYTCAYGNGFWLIIKNTGAFDMMKSTDGINYVTIPTSAMTFISETGAVVTNNTLAPIGGGGLGNKMRMKFWNGKFYMLASHSGGNTLAAWSSADGVTWTKSIVATYTGAPSMVSSSYFTFFQWGEDGNTLFIPNTFAGTPVAGSTYGYGWSTTDGVTWTQVKNINQSTNTAAAGVTNTRYLTRINGVYMTGVDNFNGNQGNMNSITTSTDGVNWTTTSMTTTVNNISGTAGNVAFTPKMPIYVNGTLFLICDTLKNFSTTVNNALTSTDGLSWTGVQVKLDNNQSSGTYGTYYLFRNGVLINAPQLGQGTDTSTALANGFSGIRTSVDGGVTWTYNPVGTNSNSFWDLAAM